MPVPGQVPPPIPKSLLKPSAKEVEWEVLPPENRSQPRSSVESVFRLVSLVMDRLIRIPGLKKRLGFNPIVDLVPGFGDLSAALVLVSVIVYRIRRGIPKIVLGRMALHVLIYQLVRFIPVVGFAFALWFLPHTRNF